MKKMMPTPLIPLKKITQVHYKKNGKGPNDKKNATQKILTQVQSEKYFFKKTRMG